MVQGRGVRARESGRERRANTSMQYQTATTGPSRKLDNQKHKIMQRNKEGREFIHLYPSPVEQRLTPQCTNSVFLGCMTWT
jgi:hypothetical protein